MSPLPAFTPFAAELYKRTGPLAAYDESNNYAWATFCVAVAAMFDGFENARDTAQGPGFSGWLDIDRAPTDGLGWLAQFAGVSAQPGLTDAQQRARIRATDGFKRGTPAAIMAAAQTGLTGTKRVVIYERDGGDAYALRVVTFASETPTQAVTLAALKAAKPVGLVLTYQVLTGWFISDMETFYMSSTIATGPEAAYATLDSFESRV